MAVFGVDAGADQANLALPVPDSPESPLRQLFEPRVACQAAKHGELEDQGAGAGTAGLSNLRRPAVGARHPSRRLV